MTAQEILDEIRILGGRLQARGSWLHIDAPKGVLKPEHREALATFKPELLALLKVREDRELEASIRRLEAANIRIALFVTEIDAGLQVSDSQVRNDSEAQQAMTEGGVIYTPMDMFAYIQLAPNERRILHDFKRRFRGTVEWKASQ